MPIRDRGSRKIDGATDENSLYAELWEYALTVMALDHFFREVIEGNVPLTDRGDPTEQWWEQKIVAERVNRYSQPWCLVYEGVSRMRERLESQVMHSLVQFDQNLAATFRDRRGERHDLTWEAEDQGLSR